MDIALRVSGQIVATGRSLPLRALNPCSTVVSCSVGSSAVQARDGQADATCGTIGSMAVPSAPSTPPVMAHLTPDQQAWLRHSESLWRKAHELARLHPDHDPSDLYHALRCLELTPAERLRAGLQRGRLRADAR